MKTRHTAIEWIFLIFPSKFTYYLSQSSTGKFYGKKKTQNFDWYTSLSFEDRMIF